MSEFPYSTVALSDGAVIGGAWPNTIIAWPGGQSRRATKPEYDLFQAMERLREENQNLARQAHQDAFRIESLQRQLRQSDLNFDAIERQNSRLLQAIADRERCKPGEPITLSAPPEP